MKKLILILFLLTIAKESISSNLFSTKLYEINFTSNNVYNDKIKQISQIKFLSFKKILSNILTNDDFNLIKRDINEDFINTFIKNIIVKDEKIINNNYYSKVKVNFNKKKIIDYFRSQNLIYIDYYPESFLTIIYERNQITKNLFTKNNAHYNFLKNNYKKIFFKKNIIF